MIVSIEREEFRVDGICPPISHYTDAVRFGNLLFISGIAPADGNGKVVFPDDPVAQTRFILECMQKVLESAGASFENILRVTVYLTDVADRVKINPVRQEFFGSTLPASTLIGVKALALPGMRVEIEAVAGLPL